MTEIIRFNGEAILPRNYDPYEVGRARVILERIRNCEETEEGYVFIGRRQVRASERTLYMHPRNRVEVAKIEAIADTLEAYINRPFLHHKLPRLLDHLWETDY